MVAYAWKPGTPGAWKGGALKVGSWGPETASSGGAPSGLEIVSFTASPLAITAGQTVTFDYYVSGSAVRVELDQDDDGSPNTARSTTVDASASATLLFASAGTYSVSLKIHNTSATAVFTRTNYITVAASSLGALGGGAGGLSFDMHGGLAGTKTSRSATAFGLRKKRRS